MNRGLDRLLTLAFGTEGNEANYLGTGWSGAEPGNRWMIGQRSELWLDHPGTGHDLVLELDLGIMGLSPAPASQRLVVGVRDKGIAQITVSRGGALGFHIPATLIEAPGPIRITFIHPDFRRPSDVGTGTDDRQLSFSMRNLRLFRVLQRPETMGGAELPRDELMMRFESLGDNCEFGLVQRSRGAEPLGLLRFAFIESGDLLRGLRTGFHALGEPDTTEVTVSGKDREFIVNDTSFGMTFHTWQYETQLGIETVRQQQTARLSFLKRKFIEDVADGEKIFVIKRLDPLRPEEVLPIYMALNESALNRLLWVVPADEAHSPGTVEVLLPGLLRGYVDRFAPYANAPDLSLSAWTAVCEAAWRIQGHDH